MALPSRGYNDKMQKGHSLGVRFSLYIFIILLVVNFFSLFFIYKIQEKQHLLELQDQGRVIANYIASSVSSHLLAYDFITLDTILTESVQLEGVYYSAILADNEYYVGGRVALDDTKQIAIVPDVHKGQVHDYISMIQKLRLNPIGYIDVSMPIIFADTYLGRVVVGVSMNVSRDKTTRLLLILLIVNGVVALFVAAGIYFFFWKRVLCPVRHLINGAERVANSDFDKPVSVGSNDELGLLATSFNGMMLARKEAEESTRKSKRNWERLFNAVDDVVTIQDNDMRILQANAAAGKLMGKDPSELIGKYCYEAFQERADVCPGCPSPFCLEDHKNHHSDVSYKALKKTFHVSTFPVNDPAEGWIGIAHIARDITEHMKLEAQYRQAQKMEAIGTLAGGIAHDFNNILTPILGYAQLIKMEVEPDGSLDNSVDQILVSARLAEQLVKQILTFSRERQHEMEEINVQPIIKESMKLLRASIPTTIEITTELDPECGTIIGDPTQLHQIIMNICTNAYHAMEETGGVLAVSVGTIILDSMTAQLKGNLSPGEYLIMQIGDTGIGMNQETQERIFEPFFTTKQEGKGTGMGLSVVHGIVKDHGGAIFVYSEPGEGTTFTLYFPCAHSGEISDLTSKNKEQDPLVGGQEHIMVVDDEQYIVALEKRMLERVGYQVTTYTECVQALAAFRQDPDKFEIVISDLTMPKMTGFEFANHLVAIKPELPVILCSGNNRITVDELRNQLSITGFIPKPINIRQLIEMVRNALDGRPL